MGYLGKDHGFDLWRIVRNKEIAPQVLFRGYSVNAEILDAFLFQQYIVNAESAAEASAIT